MRGTQASEEYSWEPVHSLEGGCWALLWALVLQLWGDKTHSGQAEGSPDPNAVANATVKGREFAALASRICLPHLPGGGVGCVGWERRGPESES